jgi:hypothetical protein
MNFKLACQPPHLPSFHLFAISYELARQRHSFLASQPI